MPRFKVRSLLRFNVFRHSFFFPIPEESNCLTFLFSVIFVGVSLVCFVVPGLLKLYDADASVSYVKAPRVGNYADVSEGLPNFTLEITSRYDPEHEAMLANSSLFRYRHNQHVMTDLPDKMFPFLSVTFTYRTMTAGQQELYEQISLSPECKPALNRGEYVCKYSCDERFSLQGSFGERKFSFLQMSVRACKGRHCANQTEQSRLWSQGVVARLLWPSQFPDWYNGKVTFGKRSAMWRQWLSPPPGVLPEQALVPLKDELRYTYNEGSSNCPYSLNPYCERTMSWLEFRRSTESAYPNKYGIIYTMILRLDEDHVEISTATFPTYSSTLSDIGGGVSLILFFCGMALGAAHTRSTHYVRAHDEVPDDF
eukprot:TRINITY_DN22105_c0_g1_i1.p1 TRINITY_DN22105_c0_g1~~TRINITY_DN22105_c0_g1_i1.p1  ORF type:complete len:379 (-),score=2.38 TRINITY_DN22105_c0_g1_i1:28-1131(-)